LDKDQQARMESLRYYVPQELQKLIDNPIDFLIHCDTKGYSGKLASFTTTLFSEEGEVVNTVKEAVRCKLDFEPKPAYGQAYSLEFSVRDLETRLEILRATLIALTAGLEIVAKRLPITFPEKS
jgi:hypothetical protein